MNGDEMNDDELNTIYDEAFTRRTAFTDGIAERCHDAGLRAVFEAGARVQFPLEPTPAMIEAGAQRLVRWETGDEKWPDAWGKLDVRAARNDAERCWRSMWLAAMQRAAPLAKVE